MRNKNSEKRRETPNAAGSLQLDTSSHLSRVWQVATTNIGYMGLPVLYGSLPDHQRHQTTRSNTTPLLSTHDKSDKRTLAQSLASQSGNVCLAKGQRSRQAMRAQNMSSSVNSVSRRSLLNPRCRVVSVSSRQGHWLVSYYFISFRKGGQIIFSVLLNGFHVLMNERHVSRRDEDV